MEVPFTLVTTGVLALIFFVHSLRTIKARRDTKTNLGDGDSDTMLRRIRTHGNFAEYVPFLMFILFLLETAGVPAFVLGVFSLSVILGRCLHAYGLYSPATPGKARVIGMQLTLWPLILGGMYLIYLGLV